jgi:hypothetical protein
MSGLVIAILVVLIVSFLLVLSVILGVYYEVEHHLHEFTLMPGSFQTVDTNKFQHTFVAFGNSSFQCNDSTDNGPFSAFVATPNGSNVQYVYVVRGLDLQLPSKVGNDENWVNGQFRGLVCLPVSTLGKKMQGVVNYSGLSSFLHTNLYVPSAGTYGVLS